MLTGGKHPFLQSSPCAEMEKPQRRCCTMCFPQGLQGRAHGDRGKQLELKRVPRAGVGETGVKDRLQTRNTHQTTTRLLRVVFFVGG